MLAQRAVLRGELLQRRLDLLELLLQRLEAGVTRRTSGPAPQANHGREGEPKSVANARTRSF